jgi:glycine betaine/proline transport system ATP-binding protein
MNEKKNPQIKISCKNVWKVFGARPQQALDLIGDAMTKEEMLEKTGHVVAVKNVSFDVMEGEIFVVMGLSGSGKSTLIRCLNGLIKPDRGKILIEGVDLSTMNETELRMTRRHKVSMVFQHFALFPHRTVIDNSAYGLELQGMGKSQRHKRALEALDMVGLKRWKSNYPEELSGGMQQRVGLARALALDPEILLMDEAFSALDPLIRRQMHDEFLNLMARVQKTILFISHDLNEAIRLGNRIAIMKDGEIVQVGSPEKIVSEPCNKYVTDFVRDIQREKVVRVRSIMRKPTLKLSVSQDFDEILQIMNGKVKDQAFVVNPQDRLIGVVNSGEIKQAIASNFGRLDEITIRKAYQIGPDQPIERLTPLMAACDDTVAVVDENERLIGEVPRVALLEALAGK